MIINCGLYPFVSNLLVICRLETYSLTENKLRGGCFSNCLTKEDIFNLYCLTFRRFIILCVPASFFFLPTLRNFHWQQPRSTFEKRKEKISGNYMKMLKLWENPIKILNLWYITGWTLVKYPGYYKTRGITKALTKTIFHVNFIYYNECPRR